MRNLFFTVGHATRPIDAFLDLLKQVEVLTLADVRSVPRSRTNPQFNREFLTASLSVVGIEYQHVPELGGLRNKQKDVPVAVNAFWQNQSFHNYADYAMGREFHSGLRKLRALSDAKRCVIMCAETLWWRCHRRIISDYLIAAGETVFHILGPGDIEQARITEAAKPGPDGVMTYPTDFERSNPP
jgi:uncharacterized protein (DUF488 family)